MFVTVLAILGVVLGAAAFGLAASMARTLGIRDPAAMPNAWRKLLRIRTESVATVLASTHQTPRRERIAFIVNPTKAGVTEFREAAYRACSIRYLPEPLWLYTTAADAGQAATREAVAAGVDLVVAVGGDGTVRAVAEVACQSDVSMGLVPMGTGNIFARNLSLPVGDTMGILRTLLDGAETDVDVGWLTITREGGEADLERAFLVIAGMGIDAEMVAGADDKMKRRLGWASYFWAGLKHVGDKRMTATVAIDGGEPTTQQMRTVLIGNCGRLPGGIQLIPDASVTDGKLDVASIDARGGVVGWSQLFGQVVAQGTGIPPLELPRAWGVSRLDHARGTSVQVTLASPQKVQIDGDPAGRAVAVAARVQARSLTVRVGRGA